MKKSELKKIIKEEISVHLKEMQAPEQELEEVATSLAENLAKLRELMSILDGKGRMDYARMESEVMGALKMRLGRDVHDMKTLQRAVAEVMGSLF